MKSTIVAKQRNNVARFIYIYNQRLVSFIGLVWDYALSKRMEMEMKPFWIVLGDTRVKIFTWEQLYATCRLFNLTLLDENDDFE
jgi:hypothetical protein